MFFFFNDTATTEIYTLSLHDALPIYWALEYLRRQGPDHLWSVILLRWLREGDRLGLVMFEDLGLELPMRFERKVELGERLQVSITHANPRQDIIRMAEVAVADDEADDLVEASSPKVS